MCVYIHFIENFIVANKVMHNINYARINKKINWYRRVTDRVCKISSNKHITNF